ncbi:MAG: DUF4173 domain-containing protein, partial [Propionibacteriaceae bacterium]|nr:DUF4173 domain-containing protein [Propionibacteriaceae bacterium]
GIAFISALPFLVFASNPMPNFFLRIFVFCVYLAWLGYTCKTISPGRFSGLIAADLITLTLVVPFASFHQFFCRPIALIRQLEKGKRILAAVVGLVVFCPLLLLTTLLLSQADTGFAELTASLLTWLEDINVMKYAFELVLGIPIAAYVFGAVWGNRTRRFTQSVTKLSLASTLRKAHQLSLAAFYTPLALFIGIYLLFFGALGNYLFSALGSQLPGGFSYAQYARRGFFELCAVAAINAIILAAVYLLGKRGEHEYPKALRALTGTISALTLLLVITAASKMWLYIDTFGLTQLRVYTMWFMVVLFVSFLILLAWHIRPFNAGRPMIIAWIVLFLGLFFANTNGLIAQHNVDSFLSGKLDTLDAETIYALSDAAVPYLIEVRDNPAVDPALRNEIREELNIRMGVGNAVYADAIEWFDWSIQSQIAENLLTPRG